MATNTASCLAFGACSAAILFLARLRRDRGELELGILAAVGGHGTKKNKGPPMRVKNGIVYKPFQPSGAGRKISRGEAEVSFYNQVGDNPVVEFLPKYYGVETTTDGTTYLKLEDVTEGMKHPCILDLKMGTQTYDEEATPEKIAKEKKKYPPQSVIGFRFTGMKWWLVEEKEYAQSTREWCMSLQPDDIPLALTSFFDNGRIVRKELVASVLRQLKRLRSCFADHPKWRMYGSSILIVYDGDESNDNVVVKVIDFAHVFPIKDGGVDAGYLHGIDFLANALRKCASKSGGTMKIVSSTVSQVGGAHGNIGSDGNRLTKVEDKATQFDTELEFYATARDANDSLYTVMPDLLGADTNSSPRKMFLSDVTAQVRSAGGEEISIMDVKLGRHSFGSACPNKPEARYKQKYDAFASSLSSDTTARLWTSLGFEARGPPSMLASPPLLGKRDYLAFRDASTTSAVAGFRLTASKHPGGGVSQVDSKSIATVGEFIVKLGEFLEPTSSGTSRREIAMRFAAELSRVHDAAKASDLVASRELVGTSLLLVHSSSRATIAWIDFANANKAAGDEKHRDANGILDGIQELRNAVKEFY